MDLTLPDSHNQPFVLLPPPPEPRVTVLTSFRGHW